MVICDTNIISKLLFRDSDIFIGATGLYYGLPVYTHNLKHFRLIKEIILYEEK